MKQILMILLMSSILFLLGSCRTNFPITVQSGKDDVAYLLFVSMSDQTSTTIDVTIDNRTFFEAKTVKARKANRKGISYAIGTGRRKIKVTKGGEILFDKEIFVSTQETKIISLP